MIAVDDLILALDFGGTKLSAAVIDRRRIEAGNLHWRAHQRRFTPPETGAAGEREIMLGMARDLLESRRPVAVGISFGGPVDYRRGVIRLSHHVPGWENVPLRDMISLEFAAPANVDNDANVAALGESRFGAGRGFHSLMYITVSTGVGGGLVLGGVPWRGHEGLAGEIGHMVVEPAGPLCLCGKRGCVERLASGPYMAADAEERLRNDPSTESSLGRQPPGATGSLTGRMVAVAAAEGDRLAQELLLRGARALGTGIGNAANLINPERFILGGGVTKSGKMWWDEVRRAAMATALPEVRFDIVPAELGDDAPLWGAVALALS